MTHIDKQLQKEIQDNFFKDYIQHGKKFVLTQKSATKFFNKYPYYYDICCNLFKQYPQLKTIRNILNFILNDIELKCCKKCGNILNYKQTKCNATFCSQSCANSDKELCAIKTKTMFKTNIEKYGYKVAMLMPEHRQKQKDASNSIDARMKAYITKHKQTIERWNNRLLLAEQKFDVILQSNRLLFAKMFLENNLYKFEWQCKKMWKVIFASIY